MKNGLYILISMMIIFTSCKSVSYLPVDLTLPASQPLPENVQSLTLVDRSVDLRYSDLTSDSIQLNFLRARFNLDSMMYDKAASDTLVQVLGKLLFESGRFDVVIPEERFLEMNTLHLYSEPMDWKKVTALTNLYRTDAVLAVDYFKTMVHTEFGREMIYNVVDQVNYMINKAAMKIDYTTLFRLYNPDDTAKILSFFVTDTLYWEDADFDIKRLFRRFPTVKQGLHEAGIASALKLSGRIAPTWEPSNRAFFSNGNEILENTAIMVYNNEWDKALESWLSNYEKTDSKSLRSKLEFNIALGFEMQGNLDEAIDWGVKSYQTQYRTMTFAYLEELKKRKTLLTVPNENN